MRLALVSLAGATAVLTGCAPYYPPPPPPQGVPIPIPVGVGAGLAPGDCFRSTDIRNHTVGDRSTLYLDVAGRGAYRVGMSGSCLSADSQDTLVIRQHGGSPMICAPIDLDVGMSRIGFTSRCLPNSIVRMTPAEVDALPPRLRP